MASNTANHLSLEYKTENELKFAQWAMREYGMTNKERTTHTFKGQMSVLLEVWNVVDMITLPISLVSAGGKFIGKEVAKEVAEELGEKAVKEVAEEAVEKTVKREVAEEAVEKTVKTEVSEEIAESATRKKELIDTTRVGRWMSQAEYDKMIKTGVVQESYSGTTHVANPASIEAFGKQAKPGQIYVEFDVPITSLKQTNEGWAKILGPNTLEGRLAAKKGNPIPEMPTATNIEIVGRK